MHVGDVVSPAWPGGRRTESRAAKHGPSPPFLLVSGHGDHAGANMEELARANGGPVRDPQDVLICGHRGRADATVGF